MHSLPRLLCAVFAILTLNSLLVYAESLPHEDALSVDSTLTLSHLIEKSLPNYPNSQLLAAKKLEIDALKMHAKGLLPGAPSLMLRNQNDRLLSGRGETEWEAGVQLPIWLSGQRKAREAIAAAAAQNLGNNAQYLRLQMAGLVRDALWDIQLATGLAEVAHAKFASAMQLERDVEMRVKLGDMAQKDFLIAQTETLQAKTEKINAEAEIQHAKFRYINLTGQHQLPANFTEVKSSKMDVDADHPALLNANGNLALSAEKRHLVQIETRDNPTVMLGARSIRGGFDTKFNESLGITLTIPLRSETRNAPARAAAEMQYVEQQASLSQLTLLLAAAMHEAEHNLEVGAVQLEVLAKQQTIAQQSLAITNKAFQAGELDLSDYLRVQSQAFNAERAYKNQQIQQLWNTARYNQAVGDLP